MRLQLEDGGLGRKSKLGSVFGRVAGTMVGIPPVRKSDFQKKKKVQASAGAKAMPPLTKAQAIKLARLRAAKMANKCHCVAPGMQKKVIYNHRTKEAFIVPLNDNGMGNVLTTALTSNPYGAAIKGGFDIVKGVFGGKKKKGSTATSATPAAPQVDLNAISAKFKELRAANQLNIDKLKSDNAKLIAEKGALEKQRYYFGGGGFAAGMALGYLVKR